MIPDQGHLRSRFGLVAVAVLTLIVVGLLMRFPLGSRIRSESGPRPLCHRAIDGAFEQWMVATGSTNEYPNTNGNGSASLAMMRPFFGDEIQQYGYVPGLRYGDPADLVLMYMKERTRRTWHGDNARSTFSSPRWMVLSPEILHGTCPEGGTLVDTAEFKQMLQHTVAFLKENQRPHWQAVTDEQMQFLKSIKD